MSEGSQYIKLYIHNIAVHKIQNQKINPMIAKKCLPLAEKTGSRHGVGYYNADNILHLAGSLECGYIYLW